MGDYRGVHGSGNGQAKQRRWSVWYIWGYEQDFKGKLALNIMVVLLNVKMQKRLVEVVQVSVYKILRARFSPLVLESLQGVISRGV